MLKFKKYIASADIDFEAAGLDKDSLENTYNTSINITISDLVLPEKLCAKLVADFHSILLQNASLLANVSSSVVEIEVKTTDEVEAITNQAARDYFEQQTKIFDGDGEDGIKYDSLRDQIIEQQAKIAYDWNRLNGRKLEIVNELLAKAGYDAVSKDDSNCV